MSWTVPDPGYASRGSIAEEGRRSMGMEPTGTAGFACAKPPHRVAALLQNINFPASAR
jgi:hypothetical protein